MEFDSLLKIEIQIHREKLMAEKCLQKIQNPNQYNVMPYH